MNRPADGRQVLASVLVALAIAAVVIVAVTARLGPTSAAEREAVDERQEELLERDEELLERDEELREEREARRDRP